MKRIICTGIILLLTLFLIVVVVQSGSFEGNNTILEKIISPDGNNVAIIFVRNVDATTKESYQLCILKTTESFTNKLKGIYISYDEFSVEWKDNKTIKVYNTSARKIFKQKNIYHGINIMYDKYRE